MDKPVWPTNPDGTPKSMGELTPEEQRAQFAYAARRLEREFAANKEAIDRAING